MPVAERSLRLVGHHADEPRTRCEQPLDAATFDAAVAAWQRLDAVSAVDLVWSIALPSGD